MTNDSQLSADDLSSLQAAAAYLEKPAFLIEVTNLVGKPAEVLLASLPQRIRTLIESGTHKALNQALQWAIRSLPATTADRPRLAGAAQFDGRKHAAIAAASGAVGGFFGLAGAAVEIPFSTGVMLRSIARIATDAGLSLEDPLTRLECLAVFGLGSQPLSEMDSAYLTARLGMTLALNKAAQLAGRMSAQELTEALAHGTAPVLARLISAIAPRFEVVVSEKVAAQGLPVVGAALGAVLNAAFTTHFNTVARHHFGILQLERRYGAEAVQAAYRTACNSLLGKQ